MENGNGKDHKLVDETLETLFRGQAEIFTGLEHIREELRQNRHEVAALSGLVKANDGKLTTYIERTESLVDRVHALTNTIIPVINDAFELHQIVKVLERSVEVVENKSRYLQDTVADLAAVGNGSD